MNAGTQRCHLTQTRWLLINVARLRLANRLVELRYIHIVHRQRARGGCSHLLGNRVHNLRCHHHHKLCVGSLQLPRTEKISEHRNIADPWDLGEQFRGAVVQQASHAKALAVLQLDFGLRPAGGNGRDGKAVEDRGVGEIQRADLGCQLEPHHIPLEVPDPTEPPPPPPPSVGGLNCWVEMVPIVFVAPVLRMLMPNCESLVRSTSRNCTFSSTCLARGGACTIMESTTFLEYRLASRTMSSAAALLLAVPVRTTLPSSAAISTCSFGCDARMLSRSPAASMSA